MIKKMKNDDDNIGNDNGLYIKLYDEMDNMKKKKFQPNPHHHIEYQQI